MSVVQFSNTQANPNMDGVLDVSPEEVMNQKDKLVIVDVRQPEEFVGELGHIPGAQLLVLDTLPDHLNQLPKDQTIVFVCRSGGRSAKATALAKDFGLETTYNMKGGMLLWNELGLAVEGSDS